MNAVLGYAVLLFAGWASGISLYLTAALLGIAGRAYWIQLPGNLDVLSHPLLIALALVCFAVEFVADKVPFVDSLWDTVHTFVRPVGAAAVGYLAGSDLGPMAETGFALFCGTLALNTHLTKAATRAAVNTSPEPFSNIAVSTVEQSAVGFVFWVFLTHPLIAVALIVLILIGSFFLLRALWSFVRGIFRLGRPAPAAPVES